MSIILIIGAKSDIAQALAREYAKRGYDLLLTGRNIETLKPFGDDLKIRYNCEANFAELDVLNYTSHQTFYDSLEEKPEGVIIAAGYLGDQKLAEKDFDEARKILDTNYTGAVSILNIIATDFEVRKSGFIVGISSIAGDRGRGSNYFYGSAKAGFSAYLSGLRNRLYPSNVQVLTVKPGFVDTKMTRGMDLPGALTAQPEEVAADIFNAQQKGKDVIYTKWMWRYISLIIRSIPEGIFKKLSL